MGDHSNVLQCPANELTRQVLEYERRIAKLEKFQLDYQKAWGALHPDEVVILSRAEKVLLEQDPVAFMQKNHYAVFCRVKMEEQRKAMSERVEAAEAMATLMVPRLQEEVSILRRQLANQEEQNGIQIKRFESLEQDLAVAKYHLKMSNLLWIQAGGGMESLQRSVAELTDENRRLRSDKVDAVRSEKQSLATAESGLVCTRMDIDSVVTSLYSQINELRAARK